MKRPKGSPRWLEAARAANRVPAGGWDYLSRALGRCGALPASEVERAITEGRVKVDGRIARGPFSPLSPGSVVCLDGRVVQLAATTRVLAFHKPAGLIVSGRDSEGGGTVFDALLPRLPKPLSLFRWHAVGRLDRGTTGLLLFTNDERFAGFATSPATHLPKRYVVDVSGTLTDEKLERLRSGVELPGGRTRPATVERGGPHQLLLTLTEGRYHQVKLMMNAVQLATLRLHRDSVGKHRLDVQSGGWRELDPDEVRSAFGFDPVTRGPLSASELEPRDLPPPRP